MEQKKTEQHILTKKQRFFIPIYLISRNIKTACCQAGIDRSTWARWNKEPAFCAALETERRALIADSMDTLRLNLDEAYNVIVALMSSRDETIQLRAATTLADIFLKAVSMQEIEDRLSALESSTSETK